MNVMVVSAPSTSASVAINHMPAKTAKQQRYMAMVAHMKNPPAGAPSKKVAREFSHKPKGGYKQRDKRDVKFY